MSEDWFDEPDQYAQLVAMDDYGGGSSADRHALLLETARVPVAVPSTYLWKKTIEDLHVNSIWQRLRKNLLLLLQLLVVLLLALACLRPGFRGQESIGGRSIFMIDKLEQYAIDRRRSFAFGSG
ncbi:MAG: BatA domain-containing protein [Pirellulaceae bacterium]